MTENGQKVQKHFENLCQEILLGIESPLYEKNDHLKN